MIVGIGTDIVAIERIRKALSRRGEALAARLLSEDEFQDFVRHVNPERFLAKRFAAKEAALKALGTGLRHGLRWSDIAVGHEPDGKPVLHFSGRAAALAAAHRSHLSISDEQDYAVAFVIMESES
jgi:holo-[acyl-carrier protein] synthase